MKNYARLIILKKTELQYRILFDYKYDWDFFLHSLSK